MAKSLLTRIEKFEIIHIHREQNTRADTLSKLATSLTGDLFKRKYIEEVHFPSIEGPWVIKSIDKPKELSWIDPILSFLQEGVLPEDPTTAIRLRRQAANFTVIGGELYKRAFSGPYLKCLPPSEADYALREVHSGICGEHLGGRALANKILRQGFYWPTIKQDALEFTKKCNNCQLHSNLTHLPATELSTFQSPWPFAQWGIDIMEPFPIATRQRKFIILAVDYFTKWVEAETLAKITEANAKQFVWKNIICRFGIPAKIITDNGTQFTGKIFTTFCKDLHIQLVHTAVAHPQANGQTEVTNRTILKGLKTRLEKAGGAMG
ncbi:hypothetical protein KFK09_029097 [Dendrobium nobile]|uniref:Integrase catalytic domain-containing protein n=1 Tax=Dendrobium nobile TaxID=94219 RepID=A0A8T3A3G5_DENNO|nr:hypothetical protein KFK09_029097 [Dendrobium nobile]